jgi:hypothetical protein
VWREWAERFDVKNQNNKRPANGGEILREFANANGVDVDLFNRNMRVSK